VDCALFEPFADGFGLCVSVEVVQTQSEAKAFANFNNVFCLATGVQLTLNGRTSFCSM
jgi:hypothetical protein